MTLAERNQARTQPTDRRRDMPALAGHQAIHFVLAQFDARMRVLQKGVATTQVGAGHGQFRFARGQDRVEFALPVLAGRQRRFELAQADVVGVQGLFELGMGTVARGQRGGTLQVFRDCVIDLPGKCGQGGLILGGLACRDLKVGLQAGVPCRERVTLCLERITLCLQFGTLRRARFLSRLEFGTLRLGGSKLHRAGVTLRGHLRQRRTGVGFRRRCLCQRSLGAFKHRLVMHAELLRVGVLVLEERRALPIGDALAQCVEQLQHRPPALAVAQRA